jgi:ABC-type phosphate transport system substrate-binding protein
MPANDGGHGPRSRRAFTKTISAAAVSTIAPAACTSTERRYRRPGRRHGHRCRFRQAHRGAGSTFDAPFIDLAFTRYQQQNPAVSISYSFVGSSAGALKNASTRASWLPG